ncbi:hypothetical protein [Leporid alphaherpesvirus 4]|uniref:Uncharacterized protein n=1 Tax=Leporid alphaherpesvirus 4 TaxID=481315 RepID=J9QQT1_9ALPH|nr:hypothetical protein [Leporid alphaherpesvirus 4]AFR32486.1 hypothetical protein [Leporid alphaherpesvirus 4]
MDNVRLHRRHAGSIKQHMCLKRVMGSFKAKNIGPRRTYGCM